MQIQQLPGNGWKKLGWLGAILLLALVLTGCTMTMRDQPHFEPYESTSFFQNERTARLPIADTVARGLAKTDTLLYTGKVEGQFTEVFPFSINAEMLKRGRERYDIYCAPCHDQIGAGKGMVVQRGFKQPPSLHVDRLRQAPPGYIYNAIANGFGSMPSYANRIPVEDRWLIVAYVEALQLSQHATIADVPESELSQLEGSK